MKRRFRRTIRCTRRGRIRRHQGSTSFVRPPRVNFCVELNRSAVERATVLMGDLNSPPGDRLLAELRDMPGIPGTIDVLSKTGGGETCVSRSDRIFSKGLRCNGAESRPTAASDHTVVLAHFPLPDESVE